MSPVGQSNVGTPVSPPTPAAQSERHGEQSGAEISDRLASARITARKLAMRRQRAPRVLIASMLILLVVVGGLGIGYATGLIRFGGDRTAAKREGGASNVAPAADDDHDRPNRADERAGASGVSSTDSQQSGDRPVRSLPAIDKTVKPSEHPLDPAQVARFQAELREARKALGARQFQQAKERIDSAKQIAVSEEQNQLVDGFQTLTPYVEGFGEAVREGLKGLETAGELKIGNTVVSVVEASPDHIVIREAGENRRYSVDQLPARLAVAIAGHWFDDRPDNKLYLGAFHFVGPPIDVAEAKRLWEEAAGAGIDVKGLLALLGM
jgi:hypothetical protein